MTIYKILFLMVILACINYAQTPQGGYVNDQSVAPGDTLKFYISTSTPTYNLKIGRYINSGTFSIIYTSPALTGTVQDYPDSSYYYGCNWNETFRLVVPKSWTSGVYRTEFPTTAGTSRILFIVRPSTFGSTSKILVGVNTDTWQAYNDVGGKNIYPSNSPARSFKVSFYRPGNTSNGLYDYEKYETGFLTFAKKYNYQVEFCSDYDFERFPDLLDHYNLFVIVGHTEYWSLAKRRSVENFISAGKSFINLSGNVCWWQIRHENDGKTLVCYKDLNYDPLYGIQDSLVTVNWYDKPLYKPETMIFGTSFRYGGYVNNGDTYLPAYRGYGGYAAFNTHNWIYNGTGLKDGQIFGYNSTSPSNGIAGIEVDGFPINWKNGLPFTNASSQLPAPINILGYSRAKNSQQDSSMNSLIVLYYLPNGAKVFNAPSITWARGLQYDSTVQRITYNVFNNFLNNITPPDITNWSPFNLVSKTIVEENVLTNDRNIAITDTSNINFSITARDGLNRSLSYKWKIDNNFFNGTSLKLINYSLVNKSNFNLTAYAIAGNDSSTITWNISVLPSAPAGISPADNYVENSSTVTFSWRKSPSANSYMLQISKDINFSTEVDSITLADTVYISNNLDRDTRYYWRVKSINSNSISSYSQISSFMTSLNTTLTQNLFIQEGIRQANFNNVNLIFNANVLKSSSTTTTFYYNQPENLNMPKSIDIIYPNYWVMNSDSLTFENAFLSTPLSALASNIDTSKLVWIAKTDSGWTNLGGIIKDGNVESIIPFSSFSTFALAAAKIKINAKVFLEGAFNLSSGKMNTTLSALGLIPKTQPYASMGYNGTESVDSIRSNIVDWILIELRRDSSASSAFFNKAVLLGNDGTIMDADYKDVYVSYSRNNYYLAVYHRNHLAIMTRISFKFDSFSPIIDFSSDISNYYGSDAKNIDGVLCMYSSDINNDYNVSSSDFNYFINDFSHLGAGYLNSDVNLDGVVDSRDFNYFYNNFINAKQSKVLR